MMKFRTITRTDPIAFSDALQSAADNQVSFFTVHANILALAKLVSDREALTAKFVDWLGLATNRDNM